MIFNMKAKKYILFSIIPLLLSSCAKNKNAIEMINNGNILVNDGAYFIDTDEERIIGMMECGLSFMLYQYSTACSHCQDSTKNFEKYLQKNTYTIYRYNVYMSENYNLLNEYDAKSFPLEIITPRVLIIKKGRVIDEVASSKLTESSLFPSAINAFSRKSDYLYTTTTLDGYQEIIKIDNDFGVLIYNSLTKEGLDKYFIAYDNKDFDEITILIDEAFATNELLEYINSRY